MPNTIPADGGAMPAKTLSRRAALRSLASVSALAIPAVAGTVAAIATSAGTDAEILALSDEILRRCAEADRLHAERIAPFDDRYEEILHDGPRPFEVRWAAAWAYSGECGRTAAIDDLEAFHLQTDRVFRRMMAIPATTQAGQQAKLRVLMFHVLTDEWRGPSGPMDWDKEQVRALLGEFAGISAAELEAI